MTEKKPLFSKSLKKPKRDYYFDIKEASTGLKYLTIIESSEGDTPDKRESHRIMIFEETFTDFFGILNELYRKVK
jgi:hypothetical protein